MTGLKGSLASKSRQLRGSDLVENFDSIITGASNISIDNEGDIDDVHKFRKR